MRNGDLPAVARLTTQLGYPVDEVEMATRASPLIGHSDHLLLVATGDDDVPTGWIHVLRHRTLETPERALIAGLVVDEPLRSSGVGSDLVASAAAWARAAGIPAMLVRSRSTRGRAHRFYERMGFVEIKRSHIFEKPLV